MKDTPLMELTLRRYEKPSSLSDRELVKKLCLSVGLLQPGDSRDVVVDVLHVLLEAKKDNSHLTSKQIEDYVVQLRQQHNLPLLGIAPSNIRRQVKRLRDLFFVEKVRNEYRITEFASLDEIFNEKLAQYVLPSITDRIVEYSRAVNERFNEKK